MAAIFLSYARNDAPLVQALVRDLREFGSTVWLDEETSGGHDWWNLILKQIRACEVFVYALSPASLDSLGQRLGMGGQSGRHISLSPSNRSSRASKR